MNTHQARAAQYAEPIHQAMQPGEGEAVRYGMEPKIEMQTGVEPTGKRRKAAWKETAAKNRANAKAQRSGKPGMFNVNKYRCWMMGNGQVCR